MTKTLVLGSGAREHALAWKIGQSPRCSKVFLHPGNAGTQSSGIPSLGKIPLHETSELVTAAKREGVQLIVIGPENLLADGLGDIFRREGFLVVGPNQEAAALESSKVFAKRFMERAEIPTAAFEVVDSKQTLMECLQRRNAYPVVLKLDALAAGKGVAIAQNEEEALAFSHLVWEAGKFGPGPHCLVVEDCLDGREISYIGVCDGEQFVPFSSATDYKRALDDNQGPNTGGMGCVSPSPYLTPELEAKIDSQIIRPTLEQLKKEGLDYRGALFVGIMVVGGEPYVLEFNVRFGDPETQVTLLRKESDLLELLEHTAKGSLSSAPTPRWSAESATYLVAAAEGYPTAPRTGDPIHGLNEVTSPLQIFYAGVKQQGHDLITSGGRVLGLGGLGKTLHEARKKVYEAIQKVSWKGMHYRSDIGKELES